MADQRYTTSASTGPNDISEKPIAPPTIVSEDISSDSSSPTPAKHGGILGRLCHYEAILDRKFGVEAQGPERILPQDRKPEYEKWSNQAVMALLWASGTMNLSCFTTGFLGWEFGLSLKQTILVTVFATLIGSATTVSRDHLNHLHKVMMGWIADSDFLGLVRNHGSWHWS